MPVMKKIYLFLFAASVSLAQNFPNGFNFNLPWNDSSSQKFLPNFKVVQFKDNTFISVNSEGHFSYDGQRIRFWGINSVADGACPDKTMAGSIAGRMRKMGINLSRFHHIDSTWPTYSLFAGQNTTRQLNAANLDRLEYFISKLEENGIFINMNLNVGREVRQNDGIPDWQAVRDSCADYAKIITIFDPYLIKLQKEYAQQLLTHVNPYTGKSLAQDPALAMVETNNENSLYRAWRDNQLKVASQGGKLLHRHTVYLDSLWNAFLLERYANTAALESEWSAGAMTGPKNEMVVNGGFELNNMRAWYMEEHEGADADTSRDKSTAFSGNYSIKVAVKTPTGTTWHIQFKQPTLSFLKDSLYTVTFAAKSDGVHEINVSAMNDQSPWNGYGGKNLTVTGNWQIFTFSFKASENNSGHGRLTFQLGKEKADYWFDDISVMKAAASGLLPDESLEAKNVKRIDYADCISYTDNRVKDMSEFYIGLQRKFFTEMRDYLKNDLGIRVPIVGTNWNVGPGDQASIDVGDYVDNHSYWDHPQFPNIPWSSTDWQINNTPMVLNPDGGTIPGLFAGAATVGKPYTISEYNHAYPNIYQSESLIFITGYSAFHDADGIMYFDYNGSQQWKDDFIDRYFDIHRNSVYMSLFPSCALALRNGYITPSTMPLEVEYSAEDVRLLPKKDINNWSGVSLYDRKLALLHSVKTKSFEAPVSTDFAAMEKPAGNIFKTDTDEITLNTSSGTLYVASEKFNGAAGYMANLKNIGMGNCSVVDFKQDDFGTFTWISLDDEPLINSKLSLITVASKAENIGMIWNSNFTSVNNNWGNRTLTAVYPLVLKLDLNIHADSLRIYPLTPEGKENIITPFIVHSVAVNHFIVSLDQNEYRTTWFGVEKLGDGDPTETERDEPVSPEFTLEQNYPNPFNPETTIKFSLPFVETPYMTSLHTTLIVYDLLGREVKTLVNENKSPGNYAVKFNASDLPSGIYFYRLRFGSYSETKKMILLK